MNKEKIIRSDKIRNKTKVIKAVMEDPMASERELAKKLWIWKTTAHEHLKDLKKTKNDQIEKIISKDLEIVELATDILKDRLILAKNDPESKMSNRDIIASADVSAKRYSLFKWDATDPDWWLKENSLEGIIASLGITRPSLLWDK